MALSAPPVLELSGGTASTSHVFAGHTPTQASSLLITCVTARGSSASEPTCVDDEIGAWTAIGSSFIDAGGFLAKLFYREVDASPASIIITVASLLATQVGAQVVSWTNYSLDFSNIQTGTSTTGDPSVTMGSFTAGSTGIAFYGSSAGSTVTPPTGYTELPSSDVNLTTNTRVEIAYDDTSPATAIAYTGGGGDSYVIGLEIKASTTNQTITADAGSHSLTGQAVGTELGRKLDVAASSYTHTGQAQTLNYGYHLDMGASSYAHTGQAATFPKTWIATAGAASFTINGQAANVNLGKTLALAASSYAHNGQDATIRYTRIFVANANAYSITGQNASLEKTVILAAAAGSYVITGQDATLTYNVSSSTYTIVGEPTAYAISGQDLSTEFGFKLAAAAGSHTLSGSAAVPARGFAVAAGAGAYVKTGGAINFVQGTRIIQAGGGVYIITGRAAELNAILERGPIEDLYQGTSALKKRFWREVEASRIRRGTWMT